MRLVKRSFREPGEDHLTDLTAIGGGVTVGWGEGGAGGSAGVLQAGGNPVDGEEQQSAQVVLVGIGCPGAQRAQGT